MKKTFFIISMLLCINLIALWYVKSAENEKITSNRKVAGVKIATSLKVHFLDIGQGDASLIDFPNGEQMLIDCSKDARILEALGRNMKPFDREIDYLVVTHPDDDHYGGCIDVFKRFTVKHILYNGVQKHGDAYWESFWQAVQNKKESYAEINQEQSFAIASTSINILYPDHSVVTAAEVPGSKAKVIDNNTSIVLRLSYGSVSALFTGDTEIPLEDYLLKTRPQDIDVDILKVGHHGSAGASGKTFLSAVTPSYATISAGKNNTYEHPAPRTLKRLERAGAEIIRTDQVGDINFIIFDTGEVSYTTQNGG